MRAARAAAAPPQAAMSANIFDALKKKTKSEKEKEAKELRKVREP